MARTALGTQAALTALVTVDRGLLALVETLALRCEEHQQARQEVHPEDVDDRAIADTIVEAARSLIAEFGERP